MAISINWVTGVIFVPRADGVLLSTVPNELRQYDVNDIQSQIRFLESSEEGRPFPIAVRYSAARTLGGSTFAGFVEITDYYFFEFEDGVYRATLVGDNNNILDRTLLNSVSVQSNNSAGLINQDTLLAGAYVGEVVIDIVNGQAGTATPIGTRKVPSNNLADAKTIADRLGIHRLKIARSMTLATVDLSAGYEFEGDSALTVVVTLDASANLVNCVFSNLTIQGAADGMTAIRRCNVLDITGFSGELWQCSISGKVTAAAGSLVTIAECFSNVPGGGAGQTAELDLNGSGSLVLREFVGGMALSNYTGGGDVSMDFGSGRLIVEATVTAPTDVYVRGKCEVIQEQDIGLYGAVIDKTVDAQLEVINVGVQEASIKAPHDTDLP